MPDCGGTGLREKLLFRDVQVWQNSYPADTRNFKAVYSYPYLAWQILVRVYAYPFNQLTECVVCVFQVLVIIKRIVSDSLTTVVEIALQ